MKILFSTSHANFRRNVKTQEGMSMGRMKKFRNFLNTLGSIFGWAMNLQTYTAYLALGETKVRLLIVI